jgi:hypothetical protein
MLDDVYYRLKLIVRPVTRHRKLWERAKYLGARILSAQDGNDFLAQSIDQTAAIGKIGSGEMAALRHYWRLADSHGHCESWGWEAKNLYRIAGVYPAEPAVFSRFCRVYAEALTHLDVLAVWFNFGENAARKRLAPKATLMDLRALDPLYHERPWSQHLAGKRVLVVSPFTDTILAQFPRRTEVWRKKPDVLPDFELLTLRSPQSAFLTKPAYPDWFTALDAMREQMDSLRFDVAIVGAGAWSIPLVTHAKSLGAWGIHLGGGTQLLFGIKGGRWEKSPEVTAFYNDAWTRPSASETPAEFQKIEGGCYW